MIGDAIAITQSQSSRYFVSTAITLNMLKPVSGLRNQPIFVQISVMWNLGPHIVQLVALNRMRQASKSVVALTHVRDRRSKVGVWVE